MKIAFIGQKGIPAMNGGQIEQSVEEMAVRLVKMGHEVFVYGLSSATPREYKKYEGVNLISLPESRFVFLTKLSYWLLACFRACFVERVRLIHWQKREIVLVSWLLKIFRPSLRQVVSIYNHDFKNETRMEKFFNNLLVWFYGSVDRVLVNSQNLQRYFLTRYNVLAKLIFDGMEVVYEDVDDDILDRLGLGKNNYVVVKSCKAEELNGLIESFLAVKRKVVDWFDAKLVIIPSMELSLNSELKELVSKRTDIILVGDQSRTSVKELTAYARLVVYPGVARQNSVLADMAYGKGVLLADRKENMEFINSGLGKAIVFDFKTGEVGDLTYRLELLLLNDDMLRSVGKQAREYVKVYHNWSLVMNELEKVYHEAVKVEDVKRSRLLKVLEMARA